MAIAWLIVCGVFFSNSFFQLFGMGFRLAFRRAVVVFQQALQATFDVSFYVVGDAVQIDPGDVGNYNPWIALCSEVNDQASFAAGRGIV